MHTRRKLFRPAMLLAISAAVSGCQAPARKPFVKVDAPVLPSVHAAQSGEEMSYKQRIRELIRMIRQGNEDERWDALKELKNAADHRSVPMLIDALDARSHDVQSAAVLILGELKAKTAVPSLLKLLKDPSLSYLVIGALADIGDRRAVQHILPMLDSEDPAVQVAAIDALGDLGDRSAVIPLTAFLKKKDTTQLARSIKALGKLADEGLIPDLIPFLADNRQPVRLAAIEALGRMGEPAVKPLIGALFFDNLRLSAIEALVSAGPVAVPSLTDVLKHPDTQIVYGAVTAIGIISDPSAVPALIGTLDHPDANVRGSAANALRKIGDKRALLALARAAEKDQNPFAKAAAEQAIKEISGQ